MSFLTVPAGAGTVGAANDHLILVARVGEVRLGLRVTGVREVLPSGWLEPLPGAPSTVMGIIDVRGDVVAVIDGHRLIGRAGAPLRPSDRFIVLDVGSIVRILRVDATIELVDADVDVLAGALPRGSSELSAAGVIRLPDGLLLIHDPDRFLTQQDAAVLDDALDGHRRSGTR